MKKFFLFSLIYFLFSISIGFGQTIEFEYKLPDFVLNNKFLYNAAPFDGQINFKISHNFKKVVVMNGYYNSFDEMDFSNIELKDLNRLKHNLKKKDKIWLSKVLFLDEGNQIIKERVFPYYCIIDLLDYSQNPVVAITKLKHHGNYLEQIKTDFYDLNGNFLKSFDLKDRQELFLFKSCDNNFYYFASYIDVDLAGYFEIYPVKNLFGSLKNKNGNERYIINFKNGSPSAFLLLGGEEVKAVFAKGATIKMIGLKNREDFWKIENIGANISDLLLNDENQIVVDAYPFWFIIDPETGKTITKINSKQIISALTPTTTKNRIVIGDLHKKRKIEIKGNKLILPAYQLASPNKFEIVINNFNAKNTEKSVTLYEIKNKIQLPKRKTVVRKHNKIYYATIDKDNQRLVIYSLPQNEFSLKKKVIKKQISSLY